MLVLKLLLTKIDVQGTLDFHIRTSFRDFILAGNIEHTVQGMRQGII